MIAANRSAPTHENATSVPRSTLLRPDTFALLVAGVLALLVPLLAWWSIELPGRSTAATLFVLVVPGLPIALLLSRRTPVVLALAPAISLASFILINVGAMVSGWWMPRVTLTIVAMVSIALTGPAARSRGGSPRRAIPPSISREVLVHRLFGANKARMASLGVLAIAIGLWVWAAHRVDLDAVGARGLIAVLGWQYYVAVLLIVAVVASALVCRRLDPILLSVAALATIVVLYLFVSFADGTAAFPTGYVHAGFIDAIERRGDVLSGVDARFSWAGFFSAGAALSTVADMPSVVPLLGVFPLVANALVLAPVYVIALAVTSSKRRAWLSVFVFLCANWVQQDYFAPQAVAFFFYVTVIATLIDATRRSHVPRSSLRSPLRRMVFAIGRTPGRAAGASVAVTVATEAALILVATAMVVSHQLTPVALIVVLAALSLIGIVRNRTLWFGVGVIFASWFSFGATDWWFGHLSTLIEGFGHASQTVQSGLTGRLRGDEMYQQLQMGRVAWSVVIAVLGVIGWWHLRHRRFAPALVALVLGPVALVAGQSYGGEMILRVFLYALPALAPLAATAVWLGVRRARSAGPTLLFVSLVMGMLALTTARGVNVSYERVPTDVYAASEFVLERAPNFSTVRPLQTEATLRIRRITELRAPAQLPCDLTPFECLVQQAPDYVVLTTTREHYEQLVNGAVPDYFGYVGEQLEASGGYRKIWQSRHAAVYERIGIDTGGA